MAVFPAALNYILNYEEPQRKYDITADNRGQVCAGVNSLAQPAAFAKIAALNQEQRPAAVADFYHNYFWNLLGLDSVQSQDVANRVMDMAVNAGPVTAIKLLQQAVNSFANIRIATDGGMGPITIAAVNAADTLKMLAAYRQQRSAYYEDITERNPADVAYLKGWLIRAQT